MGRFQPDFDAFRRLKDQGNLIPVFRTLLADRLTPAQAYRKLVRPDGRFDPSFLFESVEAGQRQGRYSLMGARPESQIVARGSKVRLHGAGGVEEKTVADPLTLLPEKIAPLRPVPHPDLPRFCGGWVGYAGYDSVRYVEGEQLPHPPRDDRGLPDLHFSFYRSVVVFDHARKILRVISYALLEPGLDPKQAYERACREVDEMVDLLEAPEPAAFAGADIDLGRAPRPLQASNMTREQFGAMVEKAKTYISAGDIFQVVLSQRFERETRADPFDVYRMLRVINPSPYMFYLQAEGCILVGSSPEILCRVEGGVLTNRPLAGTRRRGRDEREDRALEEDLLGDPKERAEHIMLVDLGRNDVGRVAEPGSVALPAVMEIERYSHVMHISSTVTGRLKAGRTCWDALRSTLPVGTVSGAPKVRAMQIIDELEPTRRGPYAGAVGYADLSGNMDMAIALRTMVILPGTAPGAWRVHLQAGAGIVADSRPDLEYQETVNKSAAMALAVDLAEESCPQG